MTESHWRRSLTPLCGIDLSLFKHVTGRPGPTPESISCIRPLTLVIRIWAFLLILRLPLAAQNDPAILQIRIIEGQGTTYPIGSRATRGVTVQVTDETGKPVESASVIFRLPDDGPSGMFSSGIRTEAISTAADGRATVWGMQWNRITGPFEIRITAAKGQARAGTVCGISLVSGPASPLAAPDPAASHGGRSHRKLWIGVGIAAGVFAGLAGAASRGTPGTAASTGVTPPQIGTPTIILGRP